VAPFFAEYTFYAENHGGGSWGAAEDRPHARPSRGWSGHHAEDAGDPGQLANNRAA